MLQKFKYLLPSLLIMLAYSGMLSSQVSADTVTTVGGNSAISTSLQLTKSKIVASLEEEIEKAVVASYTPNTYPIGQCTWGAKELAPWAGNNWGNAVQWVASASAAGFEVGSTPKVGAIMVWNDGSYGHVAVVTDVAEDGKIQVQESNYAGNMTIANYRGFFLPETQSNGAEISYIYPKGIVAKG